MTMTVIKLTKSLNTRLYFVLIIIVVAGGYGLSSYPDVYDHQFVGFLVSVSTAPFALLYLILNLFQYCIAPKHFTLDVVNGVLYSEREKVNLNCSQIVRITYIFKRFSLSVMQGKKKSIKTGLVYSANINLEDIRSYFIKSDRFELSEYH
ncbi:hypothetical protein CWE09_11470 [Aliidiomarina minuta]|uniref:Uncharacterized protein n=1 Tax=Aliidiomarina minuta TaxID=880057 RepID=A0A432W4Y8_9GAMM|nr:hypothetical protein CWE09_11470 [Aliidiomarina minuta]